MLLLVVIFTTFKNITHYFKPKAPIDPHVFIQMPDHRPLPLVTLQKEGHPNFTTQQFKGKWHLIYFGYTFCPDICPLELTELHTMMSELKQKVVKKALPKVVFISIDPKRDTPKKVAKYVKYFDPSFMGLTGKQSELRILGTPFGIDWHIEKNTTLKAKMNDKNYIISHSTTILMVNPQGQVVGMFPAPHNPAKMVQAYIQMINK